MSTTNPLQRLLSALLLFGAAGTNACGDATARDVTPEAARHAAIALSAAAKPDVDGAQLGGGSAASAIAASEACGARGTHRRVHSGGPKALATAACPLLRCIADGDYGHRQQLHFVQAGADGLHTSTPPPTANG